jgi:hypothetical protein
MDYVVVSLIPLAVLVAALSFWAYALIDFTRTGEEEIRTFSRPVWLVILVFGSCFGALGWMIAGRPQRP